MPFTRYIFQHRNDNDFILFPLTDFSRSKAPETQKQKRTFIKVASLNRDEIDNITFNRITGPNDRKI